MGIKQSLKKFFKTLNPVPPVGGLEISELMIRYVWIKDGELITASVPLAPDIMEAGKIKDRPSFVSALKNLRSQIPGLKKNDYVILVIPSNNVYLQVFNIPFLASEKLEDAARLNLQMISPIEVKNACTSWQKVGETQIDGGQFELLGACSEAQLVEDYIGVVKEADFRVAAVEFPSLALIRLIARLGESIDFSSPSLVLHISSEGVAVMIMRNNNLYFNHFNSWRILHEEIGKREITLEDFQSILLKEVQRILNFYSTHWGGQLDKLILVSEGLTKELNEFIEKNFNLKILNLSLREFKNISPSWYVSLGAALRGLIPRASDEYISLTAITVKKEYFQTRILSFSSLWRNIAITTVAFVFIIFLGLDSFLLRTESATREQAFKNIPSITTSEIDQLKTSAANFNRLVSLALKAGSQSIDWTPLLEKLSNLAGGTVTLERISFDSTQRKVLISGRAINQSEVINFKDKISKEQNFFEVDFRLSDVKIRPDGAADFNINFKLRTPGL